MLSSRKLIFCQKLQSEDVCMLAWGNVNLFDFRGRLIQGKVHLDLWPAPLSFDSMPVFNPLGITGNDQAARAALDRNSLNSSVIV